VPTLSCFYKKFREVYNELTILRPRNFEVIFISIDRNKEEFQASLNAMPWLTIPYPGMTDNSSLLILVHMVKF
jgi:nucleoredoxin